MGGSVSITNIVIHALVTALVVSVARGALRWKYRPYKSWLVAIMVATVGVLLLAHVAEVIVWSIAYRLLGAAPPGADVLYFAFVNYTTLGYGDVLPVERWQLLGPMAAMNGIVLFGW